MPEFTLKETLTAHRAANIGPDIKESYSGMFPFMGKKQLQRRRKKCSEMAISNIMAERIQAIKEKYSGLIQMSRKRVVTTER